MATKTGSHTTDNLDGPDPVIADILCTRVRIREIAATTQYLVHAPSAADAAITRMPGEESVFVAPDGGVFHAGQAVAYTEIASGSITMDKICE